MMAVTERVVVLMSPKQKSEVARRAAAERLSVGDYMRRQALGNDELLNGLLAELKTSTETARAALDRTLARLSESERRLPKVEAAARARAKSEFATIDPNLVAQLTELGGGD
jgi:hypothetical protein